MAKGEGGRRLGVVVEGQPDRGRTAALWVTAWDLETGAVGQPEELTSFLQSDQPFALCRSDDPGWKIDTPYAGEVDIQIEDRYRSAAQTSVLRARLSRDHACVDALIAVTVDDPPASTLGTSIRPGSSPRSLPVALVSPAAQARLTCSAL